MRYPCVVRFQEYHAVRDKAAIERHVDVLTKLASRGVLETSGEATHQVSLGSEL